MKSNLYSLNKLFTDRLFRIPDYQRGYAWQERHVSDFWTDLINLKDDRYHYAGVITLEEVPYETVRNWNDDLWIVKLRRYEPYYVVDGQQRLTTAIVLLQAILEAASTGELNTMSVESIRRRFIFETKDQGVSRSYIFGYADDDFSYEFLKSKIFVESRDVIPENRETVYTSNLLAAKEYFGKQLQALDRQRIEKIFERLTQQFLFNVYIISDDVDVCMAFETMNNRGRPLSRLELLKNRLIYLSTKMDIDDDDRNKLRRSINDSWRAIYHQLGRSKVNPLDDDDFLKTHYSIYFPEKLLDIRDEQEFIEPRRVDGFGKNLLSDIFVEKRIDSSQGPSELSATYLYEYAKNIGTASEHWWAMHNPSMAELDEEESLWLGRLNRLGIGDVAAVVLLALLRGEVREKRIALYSVLEQLKFYRALRGRAYYYYFDSQGRRGGADYVPSFAEPLVNYARSKISMDQVLESLRARASEIRADEDWRKDVRNGFRSSGFYSWNGMRYFLYEYEMHLQKKSRAATRKLEWTVLDASDGSSIEHIYPQNARKQYWTERFQGFTPQQRETLRNSLGNLLPLGGGKNSALGNLPFPNKMDNGNGCGYRFGSLSENEVCLYADWSPHCILDRGLKLLDFMQSRWCLELGDHPARIEMLGLTFLKSPSDGSEEPIVMGNS